MDDDLPADPPTSCTGERGRLASPIARLLHPDSVTVLEIAVRGERVVAHQVSATDPGLVTGCSSVLVAAASTDLVELLVCTGYAGRSDATSAADAMARGLPSCTLGPASQQIVELVHAVEAEVERQRREATRAGDEHDA